MDERRLARRSDPRPMSSQTPGPAEPTRSRDRCTRRDGRVGGTTNPLGSAAAVAGRTTPVWTEISYCRRGPSHRSVVPFIDSGVTTGELPRSLRDVVVRRSGRQVEHLATRPARSGRSPTRPAPCRSAHRAAHPLTSRSGLHGHREQTCRPNLRPTNARAPREPRQPSPTRARANHGQPPEHEQSAQSRRSTGTDESAVRQGQSALSSSVTSLTDFFGVAEEHRGVVGVEQRVVDAGEAAVHRALQHDHRVGSRRR